jgi:hypothetical protein
MSKIEFWECCARDDVYRYQCLAQSQATRVLFKISHNAPLNLNGLILDSICIFYHSIRQR